MSDLVENVVSEVQSMVSGKSGKKKKKGAKKGGDPTMNLLLLAGAVGIGYLVYKNSSGPSPGVGVAPVGTGVVVPVATPPSDNPDFISAGSPGPIVHQEFEAVYF